MHEEQFGFWFNNSLEILDISLSDSCGGLAEENHESSQPIVKETKELSWKKESGPRLKGWLVV